MSNSRLPAGGRIDRSRPLRFSFDGKVYSGFAGDTLASALLANGVHLLGRSFKYHRPRGIMTAGPEEPCALVTVRRDEARCTPNLRATQVELYDGLCAFSQNRWPSLAFDIGQIAEWFSALLPAGFYYKTFMWPRSAWHKLYEPLIRRTAGLGKAPRLADPDRYAQQYAHCDVLVIGAGAAGLAAAQAAAASGARVIICDERPQMGGTLLLDDAARIDGRTTAEWVDATLGQLRANPRVRVLPRTTAFGYFPHNLIGLSERLTDHLATPPPGLARERLWQVRAREVVLATGAIEQPLVFPGNDRPGIMLCSAALHYLKHHAVLPGHRIVVASACDSAYRVARSLQAAGAKIVQFIDLRSQADRPALLALRESGVSCDSGLRIVATRGGNRVTGVDIARIDSSGALSERRSIDCDLVLMAGGYVPSVHLFSQSRGRLRYDETLQVFVPGESAEQERSAGACRGIAALAEALLDGARAGVAAAAAALGAGDSAIAVPNFTVERSANAAPPLDVPRAELATHGPKAFVDFQHDVTLRDLDLAVREGFRSIEHIKRYTTTGMATDQGKTSNLNALHHAARELGQAVPAVGLTTFRMPYTPVTFASFAGQARGELFDPVRRTPMHAWAVQQGAVFEDVSLWKRARYFPRGREDMHAAVARECRAVREHCGIFDASTLGKIAVVGPDAVEFMNRMYVNEWSKLAVGRSKYGVLLRDDGFVYDDGVVARVAEDRFHVTTTTGGAARVLAMMEDYRQTEWSDLKVWLTSTTEEWAVIALQGPRARELLAPLVDGLDISAAALPHMGVVEGTLQGVPMLLFRVSFTGELGFEVNVPASEGAKVIAALHAAGERFGLTPYGTETMHVLRAEKGFIIIGQDTDGTLTPDDVGLSWAIGKSKRDFVGKRALARPSMQRSDRKQLVGLLTRDPQVVLEEGAQIVDTPNQRAPMTLIGHVTSSYASATLGRSIAMAVVAGGRSRMGQTLYIPMPDGEIPVEVCNPVFYDPKGARLNV
ncbi:MAG: sarcosine oxidase subunit alpha family protein [Sinobacteraceae bacterium]|nr:sarcosine oxidase subunit alpha family protein [Nevskiaceae bacterium]